MPHRSRYIPLVVPLLICCVGLFAVMPVRAHPADEINERDLVRR